VVNIYHTMPAGNNKRNTSARRVHWASDGTPVLDMILDREILPENRTVYATITVGKGDPINTVLEEAKSILEIPNSENVRGNITLPVEMEALGRKVSVTWKSSNPTVVTDQATGDKGEIPAGVVTRQSED